MRKIMIIKIRKREMNFVKKPSTYFNKATKIKTSKLEAPIEEGLKINIKY